ncbi:uncharacterized protein [Spinacia oleracea]|uniref:Uncharacterized protein n=1 Tax=Spinacia oleracea TaxID=3562 RepID=A0ABM3QRS4_SPIOL|nr:uncharacterized protein LOC130461857 [Spinacia oleracea]
MEFLLTSAEVAGQVVDQVTDQVTNQVTDQVADQVTDQVADHAPEGILQRIASLTRDRSRRICLWEPSHWGHWLMNVPVNQVLAVQRPYSQGVESPYLVLFYRSTKVH